MYNSEYEGVLGELPLPRKYLTSCHSLSASDTDSIKDLSLRTEEGKDSSLSSSISDNNDTGSIGYDGALLSRRIPRSNGWGSAESGLDYLGRARRLDRHGHGLYERRSEERKLAFSPTCPRRMDNMSGAHSEKKPHHPARSTWLPVNTENVLAKVRELLRSRPGFQKARKQLSMESKSSGPLKACHSPGFLDKERPHLSELGLEAQVLYNLEMKNKENTAEMPSQTRDHDSEVSNNEAEQSCLKKNLDVSNPGQPYTQTEDNNWNKGLSGLTFGSSRGSDTVPTAHVSPSLLSQAKEGKGRDHHSTSGLHKFPSDEALHSRHRSSNSHHLIPSNDGHQSGFPSRWSSEHNMISDRNPDDFQPLFPEGNVTIDQSGMYPENDSVNSYGHRGVAVGLPMRQTWFDGRDIPTTRLSESTRAPGQQPLLVDQQHFSKTRDIRYSYPNNDRKEAFSVGGTDGLYPFSQSGSTPMYNTQMYCPDHSSGQYASSHLLGSQHVAGINQLPNDFTSWEQKHQESLRKQQMEMSEPTVYLTSGGGITYRGPSSQSVVGNVVADPHKLDSIKCAADNIIKEKDMIIERQKLKILDLEYRCKESERDLHKDLYLQAHDKTYNLAARLQDVWSDVICPQEYENENTALKRQLAEKSTASNKCSSSDLENKLGAAEHEIQHLRLLLKQEIDGKKNELTTLIEKVKEKDDLVLDWKNRYDALKKSHEALQKKLDGMKRYFVDLPTTEEASKKDKEIKALQEENVTYEQQIADLEKKLSDSQKGVSSRDALIKSLEDNVRDMEQKIEKLEAKNKKLRDRLNQDGSSFDDVEELQYENKRLKTDLDKAKKLIEITQKKAQQMEARNKTEITELKERLNQEESAVIALREDVLSKEQHLKKLRQSFKEISNQNQDLIDTNMTLKDRIKSAEEQTTSDVRKLEKHLIKELSICFTELSNLIHVCVQRAEGQDPNISALLGIRGTVPEEPDSELESADCLQSLKSKVTEMRELRDEVDKLRELISNKYAEDVGENFNGCTTQ